MVVLAMSEVSMPLLLASSVAFMVTVAVAHGVRVGVCMVHRGCFSFRGAGLMHGWSVEWVSWVSWIRDEDLGV